MQLHRGPQDLRAFDGRDAAQSAPGVSPNLAASPILPSGPPSEQPIGHSTVKRNTKEIALRIKTARLLCSPVWRLKTMNHLLSGVALAAVLAIARWFIVFSLQTGEH